MNYVMSFIEWAEEKYQRYLVDFDLILICKCPD